MSPARPAPSMTVEPKAGAKPWQPSVLLRMLLLCQREADRIELWQRTREGLGIEVPAERWDPGQRAERDLFLRLAQLVHIVETIEPDFRRLVKQKFGNSLKRRAPAKPEVEEETADVPAIIAAE